MGFRESAAPRAEDTFVAIAGCIRDQRRGHVIVLEMIEQHPVGTRRRHLAFPQHPDRAAGEPLLVPGQETLNQNDGRSWRRSDGNLQRNGLGGDLGQIVSTKWIAPGIGLPYVGCVSDRSGQ